jgi:hypothetical protein
MLLCARLCLVGETRSLCGCTSSAHNRAWRKAPALLVVGGIGAFGLVALAIGLRPSEGPAESKSTTRPPEGSGPSRPAARDSTDPP